MGNFPAMKNLLCSLRRNSTNAQNVDRFVRISMRQIIARYEHASRFSLAHRGARCSGLCLKLNEFYAKCVTFGNIFLRGKFHSSLSRIPTLVQNNRIPTNVSNLSTGVFTFQLGSGNSQQISALISVF